MKHAKKSAQLALVWLLAIALPGSAFGTDPRKLTFNHQIRTKLYIGTPIVCDPFGVIPLTNLIFPPLYQSKLAAYMGFCEGTDTYFQENPTTGIANPVDARITAIVNFKVRCEVGNPLPVEVGQITVTSTTPGIEPGQFSGIVNPTTIKNTILQDGRWAFVVSGSPSVAGEVALLAFRDRTATAIWHRVTGKITCGVNNEGWPSAFILASIPQSTRFPSHRLYWYTGAGVFTRIGITYLQNAFSNLWYLPPVPPP